MRAWVVYAVIVGLAVLLALPGGAGAHATVAVTGSAGSALRGGAA